MSLTSVLFTPAVSEGSSSSRQVGYVSQNVTLSCTYNTTQGHLHACWGRAKIPLLGCSQAIISSDGHKVNEKNRVSSRYQLLGRLDKGDVSLTILNITEADAGEYGCRVEKPGLFNDDKHDITLVVMEGESMFSFIQRKKFNYRQASDKCKGIYRKKSTGDMSVLVWE